MRRSSRGASAPRSVRDLIAQIYDAATDTALWPSASRVGGPSDSRDEVRLLEVLVPHLQRALAIQRRLGDADPSATDELSVGTSTLVLDLDDRGTVRGGAQP